MGETFVIQSAGGIGRLELDKYDSSNPAHRLDYLIVTLRSEGLHASTRIYNFHDADGVDGICSFFEDIAANWKGWKGEKRWESIEADFKLTCTSDSLGHIEITVELDSAVIAPIGWRVRYALIVEAGQLDSIAQNARKFFRL